MLQILIDLSSAPLIIFYEFPEIQTLLIISLWALSIIFINSPWMLQILMDLSSDPVMIFYESGEMQTLLIKSPWAFSIDLISTPSLS